MKDNYLYFNALAKRFLLVFLMLFFWLSFSLRAQRIFDANSFQPARNIETEGDSPRFLASGDLNNDGKPDLVVSNLGSNTITIFPNTSATGNIVFGNKITLPLTPAQGNASGIAIKDLDGDGKQDIMVANTNNRSLTLFTNTTTDPAHLTFTTKSIVLGGILYPFSIVMSDFNGDGKPDVAVSTGANSITSNIVILENQSTTGNIVLGAPQVFECGPENSIANFFDAGDLDNDGKQDLAIIIGNTGFLALMRNNTVTGQPISFTSPLFFKNGGQPKGLKISDVDGDGKRDIVVSQSFALGVFKNTYSGTGDFTLADPVLIGPADFSLEVADLDGDAKPDIVSTSVVASNVFVLRNNSVKGKIDLSSFNAPIVLNTKQTYTYQTIVSDLDGDLKPDIIAVNQISKSISIFRNTVDVTSPVAPEGLQAKPGSTRVTLQWDANTDADLKGYKIYGGTSRSQKELLGTVDQSVTTFTHAGLTNGTAYYYNVTALDNVNNESDFSKEIATRPIFPPTITGFSPMTGPIGTSVTISGTHFNPDPTKNTVFFGGTRAVVTAGDAARLVVTVPYGATHQQITVLNNENELVAYSKYIYDVTFSNAIGKVFEEQSFQAQVSYPADQLFPDGLKMVDIDGDGKNDMLVGYTTGGTAYFSVYRNTSVRGLLDADSFDDKVDFPSGPSTSVITVGDINGDGKPDVVTGLAGNVYLSVNTSVPGKISFADPLTFPVSHFPQVLEIADIDGDGKSDIISGSFYHSQISVLRNTTLSPTSIQFAAPVNFASQGSAYALVIKDLDGDGKPDIASGGLQSSKITLYANRSVAGVFTTASMERLPDLEVSPEIFSIAGADLDGDGRIDLVSTNRDFQTGINGVSVWRNVETAAGIPVFNKTNYTVKGRVDHLDIADLDGDGKPDLIANNQGNEQIALLRNIGTSGNLVFEEAFHRKNGPARSTTAADLDNDGQADLAFVSHAGEVIVIRNNIKHDAPAVPRELKATPGTEKNVLTWKANTETDLKGYKIYGGTSTNPTTLIGTVDAPILTYTHTGVTPGIKYYYTITAFSKADIESNKAPEVTAVIKLNQIITFASTRSEVFGVADFTAGATSSNSSIGITYLSEDETTATVTGDLIRILKPGTVKITASQTGNEFYNPAVDVVQTLTISKKPQVITFAATHSVAYQSPDFNPGAVSDNGTIAVTYVSSDPSIVKIENGMAQVIKAGTVTITASQAGNEFFAAAANVSQVLTVTKINQAITFAPIADRFEGDPDLDLAAVASSSLPVSYSSDNPAVAEIVNGKLKVIGNGTANITAGQPGNENYNAAPAVVQSVKVTFFQANITPDSPLGICEGGSVLFTASAASSYKWFRDGQQIAGQTNNTYAAGIAGSYTAELTFSNGSKKTSAPQVVTVSVITATINSAAGTIINKGATLTLQAGGGGIFEWDNAPGIIGARNTATLTVKPQQTTTYKVSVSDNLGCSAIAEITIRVIEEDPQILPGNVLTPNGDGKNDSWYIQHLATYPDNEVKIFDRGGRMLYNKKGYNNDWDGTFNGNPLAEDSYYYIINPGKGKPLVKGYITVIRDK